tara:strand:- start:1535 stop:3025 length:1491 start_codon:yes stop_codon:yes gene_type:complete
MPNAGLLELVAHGVQDIYLIGNPQITFFKVVYKRHTNFSMESVQVTFEGSPEFGNKATVKVPRKADLMHTIMLEVDLPLLSTKSSHPSGLTTGMGELKWIDKIGHGLIEDVTFKIGGNIIDKQYGEWMEIWSQLSQPDGIKQGLDIMLSRSSDGKPSTKGPLTAYIPLQFWFCRNIGLALPLIALAYHEIEIDLQFTDVDKLYSHGSLPYYFATGTAGTSSVALTKIDASNTPSLDSDVVGKKLIIADSTNKVYYIDESISSFTTDGNGGGTVILESSLETNLSSAEVYIMPNGVVSETPKMTDCRMFIDYIFLDNYERREFALAKHRYLIEQLQFNGEESLESGLTSSKLKLNFNLAVKELYWTLQLQNVSRNNDLFNYSNSIADGIPKDNIMQKGLLLVNGIERFQERTGDYFRLIQPYYKHTRIPNDFFYTYSFSLKPEEHQPSGVSNFSKIDTVDLSITLSPNLGPVSLKVYALNYNILRIYNGMGGIAFSN